MILDSVRRFFTSHVDSAKIDREHQIGPDVLDGLKALGLWGLQIPTDHDGIGLSATAVRPGDAGGGRARRIHRGDRQGRTSRSGSRAILPSGRRSRSGAYLPKLATGEQHGGRFALTRSLGRLGRGRHQDPRRALPGRQALRAERLQDLDHQRRLRRRLHRLRPHLSALEGGAASRSITAFISRAGHGRQERASTSASSASAGRTPPRSSSRT